MTELPHWSPKQPNGWYPHISPDGRWIAYGNWQTFITDMTAGESWEIKLPSGRMMPIGWLDDETLIAVAESPAQVYRISTRNRTPVSLNVPAAHAAANWAAAGHGHWAVHSTDRPHATRDGSLFITSHRQYGLALDGEHFVTADLDAGYALRHYRGATLLRTLPTDNTVIVNTQGDILTGDYGPVKLYRHDSTWMEDATIAPWRQEGARGALVRVDGDLWIWTPTCDTGGECWVVGRRWGERDPIVLPIPAVSVSAVLVGDEWIVAGSDAQGALKVVWCPLDHPRTRLATAGPKPKPKEEEMPLKKPEITVDEYRPLAQPGGVFAFHDRENPDLDLNVKIRNDAGKIFAEIKHRGGHGATGLPRPVNGGGPEPVPPPPPPPPPPPDPDPWETMVRQTIRAVYAEDGRPAPTREAEDFILERCYAPPRGKGWQTADIRAHVAALPRGTPGGGARRSGIVRLDGKLFVDDGGPFNPRGITFFTSPWGLKHDDARYRENFAWAAKHGFDFQRTWGKVGGTSWEDREYSVETDPDAMARCLDVAFGEYGMKTDVALIADNFDGRDPVGAARALVEVIRPRRESVILVECANEDNMASPEDENLRRVFDVIREAFPDLPIVARSAPEVGDSLDADAYPYADVLSVHFERIPPPERMVRALWDLSGHHRASGSFEPAGPWSSGHTMDDPMHLAMTSAATSMHGFGLYVFHAGAGIRHGGAWDRDRGLPANFWEQERADEQARAVLTARDLLPPDAVNWQRINGHWPHHPMPAKWVWSDGWPEGISRGYAIERGSEFYNLVIAVKGESLHPIARDCHIDVLDPRTGDVVDSRDLRGGAIHIEMVDTPDGKKREITGDGDTYTLRGPEAGGLWGYLIRGRYL